MVLGCFFRLCTTKVNINMHHTDLHRLGRSRLKRLSNTISDKSYHKSRQNACSIQCQHKSVLKINSLTASACINFLIAQAKCLLETETVDQSSDCCIRMNEKVAELESTVFSNDTKALWVFAYGSLCWLPGFQFHKAVTGHVKGYNRRFWQGNTTHRGTEDKPGRVATLVEDPVGSVHGLAFAISGEAAIPYLSKRECELGGYISQFTDFHPAKGQPFKVLLYVATIKNPLWLGDGKVKDIARQVTESRGPSGHNVEYVVRLANFMREHFPEHPDHHLFELEKDVLAIVGEKNMCLSKLMGTGQGCVKFVKKDHSASNANNDQNNPERVDSFEHTTRVPEKTLRCSCRDELPVQVGGSVTSTGGVAVHFTLLNLGLGLGFKCTDYALYFFIFQSGETITTRP
ncbi:unnamed protein product [Brassicogethes aeneus]|uniref:glutathione-specific gamma-glutamylcyclotransferase n=1 Tax=Brassicogethes aeneus TaxID=1431903 RepID=A0A9P0BBQ2_BRAAE|nr:unnamed protein product [Brassicogethes aeneus]